MRVSTKVVIDIESNAVELRESFEYLGTVAEAKATGVADQQRQQEMQMQTQAFQTQMKQLSTLNSSFSKYLSGNQGFSPQAMAGMQSQFLNSNNSTFNQAGQQVREALGARGEGTGANPVGGNFAQGLSNLLGAKAGSQSQGLLGLQVQNQMQAQNNMFNAGNLLSGNAATLTGTQGVAGNAASSALNSYVTASANSFGGSFAKSLGSSLGQGIGSGVSAGLTGGLGTAMSKVGSGNYGW